VTRDPAIRRVNEPSLVEELSALIGVGDVLLADPATDTAPNSWVGPLRARVSVRPRTTLQVSAVLRYCHANHIAVVTHGGLTGLVHGAVTEPGQLVLSLAAMRAIESIDPVGRTLRVQAGATLQSVQEAAEAAGLQFPLDLGARGSATIGGNISTNAGGTQVLRYGMARGLVLGLEAVLADGTILSSMNRMLKNNAGYDLKQLFIGSEGTLGVVTRAELRLVPRSASQNTAFIAVESFAALAKVLGALEARLGSNLASFEALWPEFYELTTTPPALQRPPLAHGYALYALVDSQGTDVAGDSARFSAALHELMEQGLIIDAALAENETQRRAMWAVREDVWQTRRVGPTFMFDVSLPIVAMSDYVLTLRRAIAERWPQGVAYVFGHVADGNLHLAVAVGGRDEATRLEVEQLVYQPLQHIGGSISAEHGIGLEKRAYLHYSRTPEEIATMRLLKRALDPRAILNPGKIFQ
jgi:FAD/FMN-containing dehydrogenase